MDETEKNLGYDATTYAKLASFDGEWRDTWWHQDYLQHLAGLWKLGDAQTLLDVGCGAGHWGQRIATLNPELRVTGVAHEPGFLEAARERAAARPGTYEYREGSAESLPLDDDAFDVVTCQTVLLHVADPVVAVREMTRVCKPGGLVVVAEPSNLINAFVARQGTPPMDFEDVLALMRFDHVCSRGKLTLGGGDAAVGERLVPLLRAAGLDQVEARKNDRCASLFPPYDSPRERLDLEQIAKWADAEVARFGDRATCKRLYLAGGGAEEDFDALFDLEVATQRRWHRNLAEEKHALGGGLLMYVAWGWKR